MILLNIIRLSIFLLILQACSQKIKNTTFPDKIDNSIVDSIWIYKTVKDVFIPEYTVAKLPKDRIKKLVFDINNSTDVEIKKSIRNYKITIYYQKDSIRIIRGTSNVIFDRNDKGYKLGSEDYLDKFFK